MRDAASHPLCLAALGVMVLNDHLLKDLWPGPITGKLSDVAWLVVAPSVGVSLLARTGFSDRACRTISLGAAGALFVLLQVWPPLGQAWMGLLGGHHTADLQDLLALPALLLAPLCWRPAPPRRLALPLAALACVANTTKGCDHVRVPADGTEGWDPHEPLVLGVGQDTARHDTVGIADAVHLRHGDEEVELLVSSAGNRIVFCPRGGLQPDTEYEWTIEPMEGHHYNHVAPQTLEVGTTTFRTGPPSSLPPLEEAADCRHWAEARQYEEECGDTGGEP